MQPASSLFKQKVLSFTIIQVVLVCFLLFVSLVVHILFNPHNYLESYPLYSLVGFFFLLEMFQFFWLTRDEADDRAAVWRKYRRGWLWRLCLSAVVGLVVCLCLSAQPLFSLLLFLIFFLSEWAFEEVYYRRFL